VSILSVLEIALRGFRFTLEQIGREPWEGEEEWITSTREGIIFFEFLVENVRSQYIDLKLFI